MHVGRDHRRREPAGTAIYADYCPSCIASRLRFTPAKRSDRDPPNMLAVTMKSADPAEARIISKLELRDRFQAIVLAYESGIVRPGETA